MHLGCTSAKGPIESSCNQDSLPLMVLLGKSYIIAVEAQHDILWKRKRRRNITSLQANLGLIRCLVPHGRAS